MTFSQYAGTAIVPTLSRIILCAAFLPQGWIKCFTDTRFDPAQADRLHALNVRTSPWIDPVTVTTAPSSDPNAPADSADANTANTATAGPPPREAAPSSGASTAGVSTPSPSIVNAPRPKAFAAPAMHKVTLLLDSQGWPYSNWLALVLAATELVGGALLLIGFLARVWGMGLAIAMGVAFWLVTVQINQVFQTDPLAVAADPAKFQTMFLQLGLFMLALGVTLTGAGPLSLDRWLFSDDPEFGAGGQDLDSPPDDDGSADDSADLDPAPPPRPI